MMYFNLEQGGLWKRPIHKEIVKRQEDSFMLPYFKT